MAKTEFEKTLLSALRKPGASERFHLPQGALSRLTDALARDLRSSPSAGVTRALALIVAFEKTLDSPTVAETIRNILRESAHALRVIRHTFSSGAAIDSARAFLRREARELTNRAPSIDANPPAGAMPLRQMLNPGRERMRTSMKGRRGCLMQEDQEASVARAGHRERVERVQRAGRRGRMA